MISLLVDTLPAVPSVSERALTGDTWAIVLAAARVLLALGIAVLLCYLFVGRVLPGLTSRRPTGQCSIRVIDRQQLSRSHQLCVVRVLDRYYVLGLSTDSVTRVDTLEREAVLLAYGQEPAGVGWSGSRVSLPWRRSREFKNSASSQ